MFGVRVLPDVNTMINDYPGLCRHPIALPKNLSAQFVELLGVSKSHHGPPKPLRRVASN